MGRRRSLTRHVSGGLVAFAIAAWLQARQWRLRHSLLSSDFQTVAAERSQAELARVQTEVFYHSLVETIPQMILCKDLEGRFTFANRKLCAELEPRSITSKEKLTSISSPESWRKSTGVTTSKCWNRAKSSTSLKSTSRPVARSSTSRS